MFCCLKTAPKDYCLNSFNSFNFFNSSIPLQTKNMMMTWAMMTRINMPSG